MSIDNTTSPHAQDKEATKPESPGSVRTIDTPRPALFPANTTRAKKFLVPAFDVSDRTVPGTPRGGTVGRTLQRPASMSTITRKPHPSMQAGHHSKAASFSGLPSQAKAPSQLALELCWTGLEIPPSNGDYHYMDYTHNDCEGVQFSDESVRARMLANRGKDHLMIRWCAYCEELACHRNRAWDILQCILAAYPNLDYTHALPSQRPELHDKDLLHPAKHQAALQTRDCTEMYLFFHPRGQPVKSLLASDGPTAVAALQSCISSIPQRNLTVTLISARNLPSAGLLAKTNPFVRFKVAEQELISTFCPDTQNPDYHLQSFTFQIDSLAQCIQVEVCSSGVRKDKVLGTASVAVSDLIIGKHKKQSVTLAPAGVLTVVLTAEGAPFTGASPPATRGEE